MWSAGLYFVFLWTLCQSSYMNDPTDRETLTEVETSPKSRRLYRATPAGIAEYRSALTLDYFAAEDRRQRNANQWYKTLPPMRGVLATANCVDYLRPASGKVARLILELFKNLEGDNGTLTIELVQNLVHANLLMESKYFEEEPDLEALLRVPESLRGEPHATFPKILTMLWFAMTDPGMIKKQGWCSLKTTSKFLSKNRPKDIAKQMKILDPVLARARYIVEEFIHHVTPIIMMTTKKQEEEDPLYGDWGARRSGGVSDSVDIQRGGGLIRVVGKPPINVPVAKMPFVDADGKVHEKVNVIREYAPYGPLPNVRLAEVPIESQNNMDTFDTVSPEDPLEFRYSIFKDDNGRNKHAGCLYVRPKGSEIVQRLYALFPYFDKDHSNAEFLHRMRGTIASMADASDALDREVAYFATILVPVIFLQGYKDTWCLLERFHRAIRFYQVSHPTEKRTSLKLLQNLRSVIHKIDVFMHELRGPQPLRRNEAQDDFGVTHANTKNIRFIKELIKSLG